MAKGKKKDPDAGTTKKDKKKRGVAVDATPDVPVIDASPVEDAAHFAEAGGLAPRRLLDRISGARLCYGKPVQGGDVTVIPVARVRLAGGWGQGPEGTDETGSGGGGALQASPIGYIEVGPDGSRFREITDADQGLRRIQALAVTAAGVLTAAAALRNLLRS
ncbi:MAG: hypothetical protein JHC95_05305 [Solirubrobacteraceae bacterium]|nr:hypothetical protein [Solirubrobacteraceae bacterium]